MDDRNYCLVLSDAEAKELQTALHWMLENYACDHLIQGIYTQLETLRELAHGTDGSRAEPNQGHHKPGGAQGGS